MSGWMDLIDISALLICLKYREEHDTYSVREVPTRALSSPSPCSPPENSLTMRISCPMDTRLRSPPEIPRRNCPPMMVSLHLKASSYAPAIPAASETEQLGLTGPEQRGVPQKSATDLEAKARGRCKAKPLPEGLTHLWSPNNSLVEPQLSNRLIRSLHFLLPRQL